MIEAGRVRVNGEQITSPALNVTPDDKITVDNTPVGAPEPSATDRAQGTGDDRVWAIVGERTIRFWRDTKDGFEPLSYVADDG